MPWFDVFGSGFYGGFDGGLQGPRQLDFEVSFLVYALFEFLSELVCGMPIRLPSFQSCRCWEGRTSTRYH